MLSPTLRSKTIDPHCEFLQCAQDRVGIPSGGGPDFCGQRNGRQIPHARLHRGVRRRPEGRPECGDQGIKTMCGNVRFTLRIPVIGALGDIMAGRRERGEECSDLLKVRHWLAAGVGHGMVPRVVAGQLLKRSSSLRLLQGRQSHLIPFKGGGPEEESEVL